MKYVIFACILMLSTFALAQTVPETQPAPNPQAAPPVAAVEPAAPAAAVQPALPEVKPALTTQDEERMLALGTNIKAVQRVITLSSDLDKNRQVITAMVDEDIESLREPMGDSRYRWASLQREEESRVAQEKLIETVHTEEKLAEVAVSAARAYRVQIDVPRKQSTFRANNRVWVRGIVVEWTSLSGVTDRTEVAVNVWINPGDGHGVPLPDIAQSAKAAVTLGVETGSKKAVASVALIQAKLVDDPKAPAYELVRRLLDIRRQISEKDPRRGDLKSSVDEAVLIIPGEFTERLAKYNADVEQRRQLALTGVKKDAIVVGDASADVTAALADISALMGGSLEQQNEGRAKLLKLIETLTPMPATPEAPVTP
jgi:hypothetical protein